MSDFIEVPVRVPADLEVRTTDQGLCSIGLPSTRSFFTKTMLPTDWHNSVLQQIAAAVEARKPKPPLFQVGDVVEWEQYLDDATTRPRAGLVTWVGERDGVTVYKVNDLPNLLGEFMFKLVRRAEK